MRTVPRRWSLRAILRGVLATVCRVLRVRACGHCVATVRHLPIRRLRGGIPLLRTVHRGRSIAVRRAVPHRWRRLRVGVPWCVVFESAPAAPRAHAILKVLAHGLVLRRDHLPTATLVREAASSAPGTAAVHEVLAELRAAHPNGRWWHAVTARHAKGWPAVRSGWLLPVRRHHPLRCTALRIHGGVRELAGGATVAQAVLEVLAHAAPAGRGALRRADVREAAARAARAHAVLKVLAHRPAAAAAAAAGVASAAVRRRRSAVATAAVAAVRRRRAV